MSGWWLYVVFGLAWIGIGLPFCWLLSALEKDNRR